MICKIDW